jgi:hypothetical protein
MIPRNRTNKVQKLVGKTVDEDDYGNDDGNYPSSGGMVTKSINNDIFLRRRSWYSP